MLKYESCHFVFVIIGEQKKNMKIFTKSCIFVNCFCKLGGIL